MDEKAEAAVEANEKENEGMLKKLLVFVLLCYHVSSHCCFSIDSPKMKKNKRKKANGA